MPSGKTKLKLSRMPRNLGRVMSLLTSSLISFTACSNAPISKATDSNVKLAATTESSFKFGNKNRVTRALSSGSELSMKMDLSISNIKQGSLVDGMGDNLIQVADVSTNNDIILTVAKSGLPSMVVWLNDYLGYFNPKTGELLSCSNSYRPYDFDISIPVYDCWSTGKVGSVITNTTKYPNSSQYIRSGNTYYYQNGKKFYDSYSNDFYYDDESNKLGYDVDSEYAFWPNGAQIFRYSSGSVTDIDGAVLRSSSYLKLPSGSTFASDTASYYADGGSARAGSNYYYRTQGYNKNLATESGIYFINGGLLSSGDKIQDENGLSVARISRRFLTDSSNVYVFAEIGRDYFAIVQTLGRSNYLVSRSRQKVNFAPEITSISNQAASVGNRLTIKTSVTDKNNDRLTYRLSGSAPAGMSISEVGVIEYTAIEPQSEQSFYVTVTVTDTDGATDSTSFTIKVNRTNFSDPTIQLNPISVKRGETGTVAIAAGDPDGKSVTISIVSQSGYSPRGTQFKINGSNLSFSPDPKYANESEWIEIKATDGGFPSRSKSIKVTFPVLGDRAPNLPPVVSAIAAQSVRFDRSIDIPLVGNDQDGDQASWEIVNPLPNTYILGIPSALRFVANASMAGKTFMVKVRLVDYFKASAETTVSVYVKPNQPAVIKGVGPQTAYVGKPLNLTFSATDDSGQQVKWKVSSKQIAGLSVAIGPLGKMQLTAGTRLLNKSTTVEVSATDSDGAITKSSFVVTVLKAPRQQR